MGQRGELNLGQLVRQKYGDDSVLVGFTTYAGSVTAASDWDSPGERKRVRPAMAESYELAFHATGMSRFYLDVRNQTDAGIFSQPRLERAIGVIYRPESERLSHYFHADIRAQFDAVYHFDVSRALEPLEVPAPWAAARASEPPETYPSGI
jgi:erythromycin esterase-like protein